MAGQARGERSTWATGGWYRWLLRAQSGDGVAAAEHARQALALPPGERPQDPAWDCWAAYLSVVAAIESSDTREAHRAVRTLILVSGSLPHDRAAWTCLAEALRAQASAAVRDTAVAYDLAVEASLDCEDLLGVGRRDLATTSGRLVLGHAGAALAACWLELGVLDIAERWIDRVDVLSSHDPSPFLETTTARLLGELLVEQTCLALLRGDDEQARAHVDRCVEMFRTVSDLLPRDRRYASYRERAEVSMSAVAIANGRPGTADRRLLEDHVDLRSPAHHRWSVAFAHAGLAVADCRDGDFDGGGRHTRAAVGEQAGLPMSPLSVFLLTELAASAARHAPSTPATRAQRLVIDTFVEEWTTRRETRLRAGRRRAAIARERRTRGVTDEPDAAG